MLPVTGGVCVLSVTFPIRVVLLRCAVSVTSGTEDMSACFHAFFTGLPDTLVHADHHSKSVAALALLPLPRQLGAFFIFVSNPSTRSPSSDRLIAKRLGHTEHSSSLCCSVLLLVGCDIVGYVGTRQRRKWTAFSSTDFWDTPLCASLCF